MCYKDNSHLGESAFQLSFTGFDHSTSGLGRVMVPSLHDPNCVNPHFLMPLSSEDLRQFGPSARQMKSVFHIMIDDGSNVHKLVTQCSERDSLKDLRIKVLERGLSVCHFIGSAKGEIGDVFKLPVFCGPLNQVGVLRCLRNLVMKIKSNNSFLWPCLRVLYSTNSTRTLSDQFSQDESGKANLQNIQLY